MSRIALNKQAHRIAQEISESAQKRLDRFLSGPPETSCRQFATASGISVAQVAKLRKGDLKEVKLCTLIALARAMRMPFSALVEDTVDLTKFCADESDRTLLLRFLGCLRSTGRFRDVLQSVCHALETDPQAMPSAADLSDETRIFDIEWEMMEAYLKSEWYRMAELAEDLARVAGDLSRPTLVWWALSYAALAYRNIGSDEDLERAEAVMAPIPKEQWGPFQFRVLAQIRRRQGKAGDALGYLQDAEKQERDSSSAGPLRLWENVKLLRRIAVNHLDMATIPLTSPEEKDNHLTKADEYLVKAETACEQLRQKSAFLAMSELSVILSDRAEFYAARGRRGENGEKGDHELALECAKESGHVLGKLPDGDEMRYRLGRPWARVADQLVRQGHEKEALRYVGLLAVSRAFERPEVRIRLTANVRKLRKKFLRLVGQMFD